MQLIGILDSPYVRRSAIILDLLGIPFEHRALSVLRQIDEFARINPVLKVPTLVLDDGGLLMDSTLIIDHAGFLAGTPSPLLPAEAQARTQALRALGLALAACDKMAQIVYEVRLRPEEKHHEPWLARLRGQFLAACRLLEEECATAAWTDVDHIGQAGITAAVAWTFMERVQPRLVVAADFPRLAAWAQHAEALPVFQRYPHP
jgi:glutathione S-transferase